MEWQESATVNYFYSEEIYPNWWVRLVISPIDESLNYGWEAILIERITGGRTHYHTFERGEEETVERAKIVAESYYKKWKANGHSGNSGAA